MPDEKYYEQRLTNAIVALQREQQSASAFLTAAKKRNSLISSICGRLLDSSVYLPPMRIHI